MLRDRGLRRTSPETTAESLLRGAHASAVLEGSDVVAGAGAGGEGDEVAHDAVRVSHRAARAHPARSRARRCRRWPGSTRWPPRSLPEEQLGRPRDAASADRLRGAGRAADRRDRRAGAGGRRGRARRPGDRGAVRLPQRDGRAGHGAAAAGRPRASTRSRWWCRRPGTSRCGAAYESNLRGYADGGGRGRARVGALRGGGLRGRGRGEPAAPAGGGVARSTGSGRASGTRVDKHSGAAADT